MPPPSPARAPLVDPFGRAVRYLRLSVTDRCDMRCVYCMAEDAEFLPKRDLLTLEELERLAGVFVSMGVEAVRITGGEPLVRRDVALLFEALGRRLRPGGGLRELTLTTNGSLLAPLAGRLARAGVRRVNVSLDTLDPERFRATTRRGDLARVLAGVEAARAAGLRVKINAVALDDDGDDGRAALVEWAGRLGLDVVFIEVMPMGEMPPGVRMAQYRPLSLVRAALSRRFALEPCDHRTLGPARYMRAPAFGTRVGFIAPMTCNFCDGCNRVRVTCTGTLFPCLGRETAGELREVLRGSPGDDAPVEEAIRAVVLRKPRGHDFAIDARRGESSLSRAMHTTGG